MRHHNDVENSALQHFLHVLRRRKWIALQAVAVTTLAAVLFSLRQEPLYQATSEVLLQKTSQVSAATGVVDPNTYTSDERFSQTQADLARVPEVAERAVAAAGVRNRTVADLLSNSTVAARSNANILDFRVTDRDPGIAQRLATAYGRVFPVFRHELDVLTLRQARRAIDSQLRQLRALGQEKSALYIGLLTKSQQLQQIELLQGKHKLVRTASKATQIQPRPVRNGILGFFLGLAVGIALALLREALDTRMRSSDEIGERLGGLPLLGRLPEPPQRLRKEEKLSMLAEPDSLHAEAFRVLRTNLEFANLTTGANVIMVTSALEAEGKSTTIANLSVALARTGKRVIAVDLDLRRPILHQLFRLGRRPGLTQVALGMLELEDALVPVPLTETRPVEVAPEAEEDWGAPAARPLDPNGNDWASNGGGAVRGSLEVLPAGALPPDVGEFVGSRNLSRILEELRERADIVLIDAPPLLRVGDAITLSGKVDAMLIATHFDRTRRPILTELRRVLDNCPAPKLGFILTGAGLEDAYGYGYGLETYAYSRHERQTVA